VVQAGPARIIELAAPTESDSPGPGQAGEAGLLSIKNVIDVGIDGLSDITYVPQLGRLLVASSLFKIGIICRTDRQS